ncbi:DUF1266 domain-containing protein [Streptomyces varsoviensis]|uniref:DUF1266 domain-containing protein n=1 Tax=Streptomyces varsoviensis TaxID=67373 RepID=UPI0033F1ED58
MSTSRARAKTVTRSWQPVTEVERELMEAVGRGDNKGCLRVLAGADLVGYVAKDQVDAGGDAPWRSISSGCLIVRTVGERLPRRPGTVAVRTSLDTLARGWADPRLALLVNPGTPVEMYLTARPRDLLRWKRLSKKATRGVPKNERPMRLLTKATGPLSGPLAHGLGCGALLAVTNGVMWNDLDDVYDDYEQDRRLLRDLWGTTTARDWQENMDTLLAAENSPAEPEFALRVRARLTRAWGVPPAHDDWRHACTEALDELSAPPSADAEVQRVIGRVLAYEARFRADGLLPAGGVVRSAVAYDYGRGVNFARWGFSARLCGADVAQAAIVRAGALSREHYASWTEFSAGYALGRLLRFDGDEFGDWYTSVLRPHRMLMEDTSGPWRSISWEE